MTLTVPGTKCRLLSRQDAWLAAACCCFCFWFLFLCRHLTVRLSDCPNVLPAVRSFNTNVNLLQLSPGRMQCWNLCVNAFSSRGKNLILQSLEIKRHPKRVLAKCLSDKGWRSRWALGINVAYEYQRIHFISFNFPSLFSFCLNASMQKPCKIIYLF